MRVLAENKKARFDYDILETFDAGVALIGHEVKSVLNGQANLTGSYVIIRGNQAELINAAIPPYQPKNAPKDYNPTRTRILLLKKKEISYLLGKSKEGRLTIVPLSWYNIKNKIKLSIGLARSKREHDKRESIKKRQTDREINRTLKKAV